VELRQLQYFAAVARHRNFTRAADELYVTQSALSQQVRRLEAELGLELLRRVPAGVELTPAGADLLAHADTILADVARAQAEMDEHAGVLRGVVRVAATAADTGRLADSLAAFHNGHPGIRIALRQASAPELSALLRTGTVHLAVAALSEPPQAMDVVPLEDEPLIAIGALDDPLVAADQIELGDLRGRPFIVAEPGTALRATVMSACAAAGFSPVPLFEVSDPVAVRSLAGAGLGISLVPESWLDGPGAAVGRTSLAAPAPRHRLSLISPASGASPAAALLREQLRIALG
jgi:DNA-binding transcriptional LysR family regulator